MQLLGHVTCHVNCGNSPAISDVCCLLGYWADRLVKQILKWQLCLHSLHDAALC